MRVLSLAGILFLFWLLLSGHYTPFLMTAGAVTALLVAWLGRSLGYADEEDHPIDILPRAFLYWPWLIKEATLSAFAVTRILLDPSLPIAPRLMRVKYSQKSAAGIATYANSITLTPGTITVDVKPRDSEFLVHALNQASAEGLETGEMDRRVAAMEGNGR
jgi:multicomponent Na+:H+ antiporter subunit E